MLYHNKFLVPGTYTALCHARNVEDKTGQESLDSKAHATRNWQYYGEIHHEQ